MTVTVFVELDIKPGKFAEAGEIFAKALQATREWEGCTSVEAFGSEADSKYIFVEEFETAEKWHEYFAWRGKESGHILESILAGPLKTTFTAAKNYGYGRT